MEIDGKVALVTGAGSGIGRASALALAREGAAVVVGDIAEGAGRETVGLVEQAGGRAAFVGGDVSDPGQLAAMFSAAAKVFGGLDIVHNNAGGPFTGAFESIDDESLERVLRVNLFGVMQMTRAALPALLDSAGRNGEAAIVNNASLMGLVSSARLAAYCASKAGVVSLTRSMALDHADRHLRVNCVCPGIVHTPMLERRFALEPDRAAAYRRTTERPPVKYLGRPEDVAAMIAYLASTEARFVTGASFTIDGGVGAS